MYNYDVCGHNFKQYNYNNIIYVGENTKNNRGIIGDAWWNNRGYLVESEHSIMGNTGSILCLCLVQIKCSQRRHLKM